MVGIFSWLGGLFGVKAEEAVFVALAVFAGGRRAVFLPEAGVVKLFL
jgi:hypothetical protein